MTMTKTQQVAHTRPQREGSYRIVPDVDGVSFGLEGAKGQMIANVTGAGEENKSNAQLFAAAPELLEALKKTQSALRNSLPINRAKWGINELAADQEASAAISKVEHGQ